MKFVQFLLVIQATQTPNFFWKRVEENRNFGRCCKNETF